jgi:uncharacterized protein
MHFPKAARYIGISALALTATIAILYHRQRPAIDPGSITLPADGAEHEALHIRLPTLSLGGTVSEATNLRLLQTSDPHSLEGLIQSPVTPGKTNLHVRWRGNTTIIPVTYLFDPTDSYEDGTPDFLRLHTSQDRQTFRAWFTSLAETQLDQPKLPPEIADCSALLRFVYRETLRAHDETWLGAHPREAALPSISQYTYPKTPLGANLFRIRAGPFLSQDLNDGAFAQFADAQTLMQHNTYLIGRDLRLARPGDLIFYRQLDQESADCGHAIASGNAAGDGCLRRVYFLRALSERRGAAYCNCHRLSALGRGRQSRCQAGRVAERTSEPGRQLWQHDRSIFDVRRLLEQHRMRDHSRVCQRLRERHGHADGERLYPGDQQFLRAGASKAGKPLDARRRNNCVLIGLRMPAAGAAPAHFPATAALCGNERIAVCRMRRFLRSFHTAAHLAGQCECAAGQLQRRRHWGFRRHYAQHESELRSAVDLLAKPGHYTRFGVTSG